MHTPGETIMSPNKPLARPRTRRISVDAEEERAWVGFYKRVGRDSAIAAEVMAQLESDPEMKRLHLALYLSCKQSLRLHKVRQARDKRIGQFVRQTLHATFVRPLAALRAAMQRGGDLVAECLPADATEPASRQLRRLAKDPEIAAARTSFQQQAGMSPSIDRDAADLADMPVSAIRASQR